MAERARARVVLAAAGATERARQMGVLVSDSADATRLVAAIRAADEVAGAFDALRRLPADVVALIGAYADLQGVAAILLRRLATRGVDVRYKDIAERPCLQVHVRPGALCALSAIEIPAQSAATGDADVVRRAAAVARRSPPATLWPHGRIEGVLECETQYKFDNGVRTGVRVVFPCGWRLGHAAASLWNNAQRLVPPAATDDGRGVVVTRRVEVFMPARDALAREALASGSADIARLYYDAAAAGRASSGDRDSDDRRRRRHRRRHQHRVY